MPRYNQYGEISLLIKLTSWVIVWFKYNLDRATLAININPLLLVNNNLIEI